MYGRIPVQCSAMQSPLQASAKLAKAIEQVVRGGAVGPVVAGVVDDGVKAEAGGVALSGAGEFVAVEQLPGLRDEFAGFG